MPDLPAAFARLKIRIAAALLPLLLCACAPETEVPDLAAGDGMPDGAADGRLRVTMVDVGQGDGLLIQFPNGRAMAVDGGPDKNRYLRYLQDHGIGRLDFVVLTHAHADHYTGLTPALALLPGDCQHRVFDPGYDRMDAAGYPAFRDAAGCRYQGTGIGQSLLADPQVEVSVLSAYGTPFPGSDNHGVNNTSVVLRLRYRGFSMLLEGDAEMQAEQAEWTKDPAGLRADVLKMGHHGSCTASGTSFLKAVAPRVLLMSLGGGNNYGMPHCQTMAKLQPLRAAGARWYRTDVNGSVTVESDGAGYTVQAEKGPDSVADCPRDCSGPLDF